MQMSNPFKQSKHSEPFKLYTKIEELIIQTDPLETLQTPQTLQTLQTLITHTLLTLCTIRM